MDQHRIRATTLGDLLLSAADRVPDRDLLIFPERRVTYRQMVQAAYRRAAALQRLGVGQGDHVGILMPNCIEYIEVLFGAVLLGAIAVPMNARYKPSELAYVVENADLKVIVTNDLISEYANFAQLLADTRQTGEDDNEEPVGSGSGGRSTGSVRCAQEVLRTHRQGTRSRASAHRDGSVERQARSRYFRSRRVRRAGGV